MIDMSQWFNDAYDPDSAMTPSEPEIAGGPNYGSMGLSAAGSLASTTSKYLAQTASAKLMKQNAAIAGAQAQSEAAAGADQAEVYRQHLDATLGKQRAQIGGSNVTVSGSPLRALANTASIGSQDISRMQLNSMRKTWGFEVQQAGDLYRAKEDQNSADSALVGGLITTGARAYGQWSTT